MKKILFTGASGFLGSNILPLLREDFKIKTSRHIQAMSNNSFATDWLVKLEGRSIELPEKFRPELEFLDWHHQNTFMSK